MTTATNGNTNGSAKLPIEDYKAEILGCDAPYLIIEAETGSGKSTMVPQWYHALGNRVLVTEPLIETVIGTSEYVAQLMGVRFGGTVGYRTAKQRKDSPETAILFCTDGLALVHELAGHNRFDVLVIDELHEWNTNQSTLEAWAWKHLQAGESPFKKIVVLSATLESDELSRKRGNAPVFKVPGRQFEIVDRPKGGSIEADISKLVSEGYDVLCFQPGKAEIEKTINGLNGLNAELIPFHGQLERAEKDRAYHRYDRPKVVVSTNALETGRTLLPSPGRKLAVVDSGMERRVELVNGIEGLYLRPIARARGKQRRGRTGRVSEGVYLDHCPTTERADYPVPEILRTRLDQTVLRLAIIAGYDATELPFFQELPANAIANAKKSLVGLGAFDANGKVTEIGRRINRLPVDVHIARMVIEAERLGVVDNVVTVAACLTVDGIRDRSGNWRTLTKEKESDLLAERDVFEAMRETRGVDFREVGVFGKALFQAREVRRQLTDALRSGGVRFLGSSKDRTDILKAICAGMVDHLYQRTGWYGYRNGGNDGERELGRESVLKQIYPEPDWIVGQPFDLEITNRRGRKQTLRLITLATKVDPSWLLEVAPQLAATKRRNYRFSTDTQAVMCDMVHIFNGQEVKVEIVPAEQCPEATQALAAGFASQMVAATDAAVKVLNAELTELQARSAGAVRGPLSQSEIAEIISARLGDAYTLAQVAERDVDLSLPRSLFVSDADVEQIRAVNPDAVMIGDTEVCDVAYKFQPKSWYNEAKQTVTVKVSVATINAVDQAAVEHLIPSGTAYTLQLGDEGYTAISGTDVAELRKQIEARRLELAWEEAFRRTSPDTTVTVKGLEPLPELPEPTTYDAVTGALAHPALYAYYGSWYQKWFRTREEAEQSQAAAEKAKATLDAEEDERRHFDQRVSEANAELAVVTDLVAQIDLEKFQSYGLSDKEAGKSYWSSEERLSHRLEQAKGLLTEDRYYGRKPQPTKALELLATLKARVEQALEHFRANETKRPEAETALALAQEERQAIAEFYREDLLSYSEDREVESLMTKATEAFEKDDYVTALSLYEELTARTAELRTKAEVGLRQKEELKKSANDRLRSLLATCPVCNSPMCEEQPEWDNQIRIRLVCRNTNLHPIDRVVWAQSNSGLTQYDYAVLATVRPEGTYKSRDQIASVNIYTDGTVTAEWYPTDDTRPFERTNYVTDVILTPEAWQAKARERYEAERQYAEEQVSNGYWFRLQFREGRHPQTGEVQWEAGSKRVKYVLDRHSQTPTLGETYYVSQVRELVNTGTFRLIVVRLEPPYPEHYTAPSTTDKAVAEPTKAKKKATEESSQDEIAVAQAQLEALKARFNRAK